MSIFTIIQLSVSIFGIVAAILIFVIRRFGKASLFLSLFLVIASLSVSALTLSRLFSDWSMNAAIRLSYCLLVAVAPLGAIVSYTIGREEYAKFLRSRRFSIGLMFIAAFFGIVWIHLFSAPILPLPEDSGALGLGGYFCALYLILISIVTLANLEQTLRHAQEHVRWEIKFFLVGMAGAASADIYIASKVLLFNPFVGLVSLASLRLFPFIFPFSCFLILVSWKRSTGRWKVIVAPGIIYSSVTLIGVGGYLILSSIAVRWAEKWSNPEISIEAALFFVLLLLLAIVLLWTNFRHRVKYWIRRNLLAGKYDYRLYWLAASDRIRSIDPPEIVADALVDIVQKAVGAIHISVWLRYQNPTRLKLVGMRGEIALPPAFEISNIVEQFFNIDKPISVDALGAAASIEPMLSFIGQTKAAVLVPLHSGNRIVGLLTTGSDRSGRPYDWDTLEFLGVLGLHAAGELHKTDLLATVIEAKENEAFRNFSTFLLHDLKNFASTLSLVSRNASKFQDNPDFQRDAFQSVYETSQKMKHLCNSLKTFSESHVDKKLGNLNQIVRTVADNISGDLSGRLVLDLEEVPSVLVDSEEIERVLRNLLLNAIEAISKDGTVIVRTRNHSEKVEVSVEDNGCGMSPDFIDKELFVPFHTTKSEGLGIGLYQSKKIVEAHKGTIKAESRQGYGTVISLFFPLPNEDA
jgi:putative PEP-CTERM system histidine kinase